MSLDYSLGKNYDKKIKGIKGYPQIIIENKGETLTQMNHVTEGLLFTSLIIGIKTITEKNWKDFYNRQHIWSKSCGGLSGDWDHHNNKWKLRPFSREEIIDHIGIRTNASLKTKSQFFKHLYLTVEERTNREIKRERLKKLANREIRIEEKENVTK